MRITLAIICVFSCCMLAHGQLKHDVHWVFGINAGLDFSQPGGVSVRQHTCDTYELGASYSDKDGNLVCYLSGYGSDFSPMQLSDKNGLQVQNGDSIKTYPSCAMGAVFLPKPQNEDAEVFLITSGIQALTGCGSIGQCNQVYLSILEIGDASPAYVSAKNQIVSNESTDERILSVKHANGRDWWLVTRKRGDSTYLGCTNTFIVFEVTEAGVFFKDSFSLGMPVCHPASFQGGASVSPNGNLIAYSYENQAMEVFSFDRCTGEMSFLHHFPNLPLNYGVAFSPSERFLYVSTRQDFPEIMRITQFDLWSSNPDFSRFSVTDSMSLFHKFALGPDGKIYISMHYSGYVSTIENPDSLGAACGYSRNSIQLPPNTYSVHSLPQMPNYNLGPLPLFVADAGTDTFYCQGDSTIKGVTIGGDSVPHVVYQWQPAPGIDSLSKRTQFVLPPQSRWYYVTITDTAYSGPSCNTRLDSVYVEVRVCTGIGEVTGLRAKVYPNPTNGLFTVELPDGHGGTLALFNLLGQQVFSSALAHGKTTLGLDLAGGTYLYRLTGNGAVLNGKLAVDR